MKIRICNRCKAEVRVEKEIEGYPYECLECDENMYEFETEITDRDDIDILKAGLKKVIDGRDTDLTPNEQRLVDEDFVNTHKQIEDTDRFIAELKKEK